MEINRNCLICGGSPRDLNRRYHASFLAKCTKCKLVFSRSIPSEQSLLEHYSKQSRNVEVSPLTVAVYTKWINEWKALGVRTHLDFGCGSGALVQFANENGIQSEGSEINFDVIAKLRSRNLPVKDFESIKNSFQSYDIITIIEVIEHVADPKLILIQLKDKLTDNGIIHITTPNFNSLNRYLWKNRWRALGYPDHINIFSTESIRKILQMSGYEIVHLSTSVHILYDVLDHSSSKIATGILKIENQRRFFALNPLTRLTKKCFNLILRWMSIGDTLTVIARKSDK